jgi:predicted nucleotidyltransferase
MEMNALNIAREFKKRLGDQMPLIDMRLFGSCARGDNSRYSDLDIFVEIETLTRQAKEKIREIAWQLGLDSEVVISPLIFSRFELEETALRSSPIVKAIKHEGVRI